ncbi:MAG: hypothetical protein J5524_09000 [Bacteroidaceae bacterium]|nr:hypothetical protein [Bacteroidaceae bacterium]MBO4841219.1 hypothetical protein [Bacteroidaceae bacterium]
MALVSKVITPFFFSEKEPYMFVLFIKESENKFQAGACLNPRYLQIYDLRKIYPDISDIYEAQTYFKEEMEVGRHEPIDLFDFTISDLTDGKHSAIRGYSFFEYETHFRVGSYYDNARETAKEILHFCVNHKIYKWYD